MERIYQTLQTVLDHIPKHLILGVWKRGQTYLLYTSCYPYNIRHGYLHTPFQGGKTLWWVQRVPGKGATLIWQTAPWLKGIRLLQFKTSVSSLSQSQELWNLELNFLIRCKKCPQFCCHICCSILWSAGFLKAALVSAQQSQCPVTMKKQSTNSFGRESKIKPRNL